MTTLNEQLRDSRVEIAQPESVLVYEFESATPEIVQAFAELTPRQLVFAGILSQGATLTQAGKELRMTKKESHREKVAVQSALMAPNMAAVVQLAVASQVIHVQDDASFERYSSIEDFDVWALGLYAEGKSNDAIAEAIDRTPKWCMDYEQELFKKIGAWTRPHAVRRGHEIGLLAITHAEA